MSTPILATKLYVPPPQARVVSRPRLIARLNEGLHRKLTLISAPAGFGKTTAVSEWIAGGERAAAWLSLDDGENDPTRFLAYLVAALQTVGANIGAGGFHSPQPPPIEAILTALLNDISTVPDHFVLVLDDYHLIDAKPVDQALTFLLEHLPPQLHLVITTREDPQLPLARLRARGQLTELRAADLRFTPAEAADFLNPVMGLNLSAAEITALEDRTEGWVAGLQLAALSLQGRTDVPGFIRAFAGDDRYIVDYLVEEVLHRQPDSVRSFLLQTSILDRMSGPLCDAVTGQQDGKARLEALERGNFFVVPLDDKRHWFRYHHLFADLLQVHAKEEHPDQISERHRRASVWYEHNGMPSEAVRHALAAEDVARAATLVERSMSALQRNRQEVTAIGWLKALPDELVRCRPVLSAGYAWALLANGELEAVEARLRDAERWLETTADMRERLDAPAAEMVVVDDEEFRRLPGTIAMYRAGHAQVLGDVPATKRYAQQVLDLAPEDDHLRRGAATALLGLAFWASGDLEAAQRHYAAGMARVQRAGHLSDISSGAFNLADISMAQGRLRDAERTLEQAVRHAEEQGEPVLRGTADLFVGLSEIQRERDDLPAATQHLLRSKELGERTWLPQERSRWYVAMARMKEAQGDLDGALDLLDEAERLYIRGFSPNVRPIGALKARVWVAQGRLADALAWAREQGLSVDDDLDYLREFEHITLARVLLSQYKSNQVCSSIREAMALLERLLNAADESGRTGSLIEILVLQALAHQTHDDIPAALVPLKRALTLAEPEGYVRIFVDEGPPMAALLRVAAPEMTPDYTGTVLAAFEAEGFKVEDNSYQPPARPAQPLVDPLSPRELEVLQLIAQGLSNREISERLYLALSSVKGHNRNIFGKLQVQRRTEAIARARELGLL